MVYHNDKSCIQFIILTVTYRLPSEYVANSHLLSKVMVVLKLNLAISPHVLSIGGLFPIAKSGVGACTLIIIENNKLVLYYKCNQNIHLPKVPSINVNIFMSVQTIHFLRPPPSPQKWVHITIFWVPKIPMKIIKTRPKSSKCTEKILIFTDSPPPKVHGLYTHENVDIYGQPLIYLNFTILCTMPWRGLKTVILYLYYNTIVDNHVLIQ